MESRGILFVLSGPSGAGKGTVLNSVFQDINDIVCSVSATTRKPRSREVDGKNYFFLPKEEFEKKINDGELLEYVEKFGNYYGTLKSYVQSILDSGKDVLLEIETIGAEKIRSHPDLKKENLRDHMSNLELVLNMLAEASTTEISRERDPKAFEDSRKIAKQGGTIAGNTRKEIEEKTGKSVVTKQNAKKLMKGKDRDIEIE